MRKRNNDPTEPRWTCARGHSNPATASECPICAALDRGIGNG